MKNLVSINNNEIVREKLNGIYNSLEHKITSFYAFIIKHTSKNKNSFSLDRKLSISSFEYLYEKYEQADEYFFQEFSHFELTRKGKKHLIEIDAKLDAHKFLVVFKVDNKAFFTTEILPYKQIDFNVSDLYQLCYEKILEEEGIYSVDSKNKHGLTDNERVLYLVPNQE